MSDFSQDAEKDLYTICRTYGMMPEDVDVLLTRKPIQIFEHLVTLGKDFNKEKSKKEPVKIKLLNNQNIPSFLKGSNS